LHEFPDAWLQQVQMPPTIGDVDLKAKTAAFEKEHLSDENGVVKQHVKINYRKPKEHHELLPILAQRKAGAPIFGAPVPGQEHDAHH